MTQEGYPGVVDHVVDCEWVSSLPVISASRNVVRKGNVFSLSVCLSAVADPGFSPGGRQLPKLLLFFTFLPKTAWKWKNLDPRGGGGASLASPLGSANGLSVCSRGRRGIHVTTAWTCSNLFTWEHPPTITLVLTSSSTDLFKFVQYVAHTPIGKQAVGLHLKGFLVLFNVQIMSLSCVWCNLNGEKLALFLQM